MTDAEIAWAAGIFEGEGCISIQNRRDGYTPYPRMAVQMTDEDVVRRFHDIVGVGWVSTPKKPNPDHKQTWKWGVAARKDVEYLLSLFWPWLGVRRQRTAHRIVTTTNWERLRVGGVRTKQTIAFKMFGKRWSDLTPAELHQYSDPVARAAA